LNTANARCVPSSSSKSMTSGAHWPLKDKGSSRHSTSITTGSRRKNSISNGKGSCFYSRSKKARSGKTSPDPKLHLCANTAQPALTTQTTHPVHRSFKHPPTRPPSTPCVSVIFQRNHQKQISCCCHARLYSHGRQMACHLGSMTRRKT